MEQNEQVIDFDYLNQIKYHKLEDKLKELGVSEAWVGGKSKKDIINDALKRLANIKVLKEKGTPEEDIQKELDLIKAEEQEQAQEALIEAEIIKEQLEEANRATETFSQKIEVANDAFTKLFALIQNLQE